MLRSVTESDDDDDDNNNNNNNNNVQCLSMDPPPLYFFLPCFAGFIKLFCPVTLLTKTSFAISVTSYLLALSRRPPPTIGDTKSFDICPLSELCAAQQAAAQPPSTSHRGRVYILLGIH